MEHNPDAPRDWAACPTRTNSDRPRGSSRFPIARSQKVTRRRPTECGFPRCLGRRVNNIFPSRGRDLRGGLCRPATGCLTCLRSLAGLASPAAAGQIRMRSAKRPIRSPIRARVPMPLHSRVSEHQCRSCACSMQCTSPLDSQRHPDDPSGSSPFFQVSIKRPLRAISLTRINSSNFNCIACVSRLCGYWIGNTPDERQARRPLSPSFDEKWADGREPVSSTS